MNNSTWQGYGAAAKRHVAVKADKVHARVGTGYPAAFAKNCEKREKRVLGDLFGLSQFGVNLTTLPPGQWSALRHWHENEDEFVYVVEGEVVLVNEDGEHVLQAGMCAGFPAGEENGHHLINRSKAPATFLEVGTRSNVETGHYPDVDLVAKKAGKAFVFTNRDGDPY